MTSPATHCCSGVLACLEVPAGPPVSPLSALTTNLLEAVGVLRAAPEEHEGSLKSGHWLLRGWDMLPTDRKQQAPGCLTQMLLPCGSNCGMAVLTCGVLHPPPHQAALAAHRVTGHARHCKGPFTAPELTHSQVRR